MRQRALKVVLAAQEKTIREGRQSVQPIRFMPGIDPAAAAALADFCLALLNCNEFLYVS